MVKGSMYKHYNNTDVAFVPYYVIRLEKITKVKVRWYNIVTSVYMICQDTIFIKNADLNNWKPIA